MQFWQFAAAVVVSYLGLIAGFFLASMTREELPTAKKYLPWLEKLVILAVVAFAMNFFGIAPAARAVAYALLLLFFIQGYSLKLVYAALGAVVAAAAKDSMIFLIITSLVFLFGLLSGSSGFGPRIRNKDLAKAAAKLFLNNLLYPAAAIILFLALGK